jgi:predicted MFS family arabinose efflux permease
MKQKDFHTHSNSRPLVWTLQIIVAIYCRLVINTTRRFIYPFAPAFSRGLDVPLTAITSMIAFNQTTAILGLFFGSMGDRYGYRLMMLVGLAILVIGMLTSTLLPFYITIFMALFLANLGKAIFDPAIQAYVGERVPFHRRGFVIGLLETSWAASSLVGIPLIGWSIDHLGWRAPFMIFFISGGLGLLMLAVLFFPRRQTSKKWNVNRHSRNRWRTLLKKRSIWTILVFGFCVSAANDNLFVVFGAWMEKQFGLTTLALGIGASVIGVAELLGEGMTVTWADRLGVKRAVVLGLVISIVSYVMLPFLESTLLLALSGIFLVFLSFEFTIVSALSLCTELHPAARGATVAAFFAAAGCGRFVGALLGGFMWQYGNILTTGLISALASCIGLLFFLWGLRRWRHANPQKKQT